MNGEKGGLGKGEEENRLSPGPSACRVVCCVES